MKSQINKMNLILRKKGSLSAVLETLFGLLIFIAVIFITAPAFADLIGGAFKSPDYKSSINSLQVLSENINQMIEKDISKETIPYYLSEKYVLVGFDSGQYVGSITKTCEGNDLEDSSGGTAFEEKNCVIPRPKKCNSQACLCLYENDGKKFKSVIDCKPIINRKIVFYNYIGLYSHPIIYGSYLKDKYKKQIIELTIAKYNSNEKKELDGKSVFFSIEGEPLDPKTLKILEDISKNQPPATPSTKISTGQSEPPEGPQIVAKKDDS